MAKRPSSPDDQRPSNTQDLPLVALRETVIFPEMMSAFSFSRVPAYWLMAELDTA